MLCFVAPSVFPSFFNEKRAYLPFFLKHIHSSISSYCFPSLLFTFKFSFSIYHTLILQTFSIISLISGTIGAFGVALLAIFDVHNFHDAHWIFTLVFFFGVAVNAIFNVLEIRCLAADYEQLSYIRRNTTAKLVLVAFGVGMLILGMSFWTNVSHFSQFLQLQWGCSWLYAMIQTTPPIATAMLLTPLLLCWNGWSLSSSLCSLSAT